MANPLDTSGLSAGTIQVPRNLARNVVNLRSARHWTQLQLAKMAGIPRSTVTNIESGQSNPSLHILLKIVAALQVPLEELLLAPETKFRHVPADSIVGIRKKGGISVYELLPDPIPGMQITRMEFEPHGRAVGVPHLPGTREYFTCISGSVKILVGGKPHVIAQGDVLAFAGNQPHSYANEADQKALGLSVVVFAPVGV